MVCFRPLKAWQKPQGGVAFSWKDGYFKEPIELPCGQCLGCRIDRARAWSLRIVHESEMHDRNCFVTLTYNDEHLPDDLSVSVKALQAFFRRLRKKHGKFRYFACGEYGGDYGRPHYHACLFGLDFAFDRVPFSGNSGLPIWVSESLGKAWRFGFTTVGDLTVETAYYVAQYVVEKIDGDLQKKHWFYQNRKAPFAVMSRKPGVGATWFQKYKSDVFPSDECVVNGRVYRPPRYYDERLDELELELIKKKRKERVNRENASAERLAVRERVAEAKANWNRKRKVKR